MAVQLPRVLKNLNLFIDGQGHAGHVDEVTLPTLGLLTEDHRAGGMDAALEIELGMQKLEGTCILSDFHPDVFRMFGRPDVPVTIRGAMQAQGGEVIAVSVMLRGLFRSLEGGSWKPGQKGTLTVAIAASYYKLSYGGDDLVEIDVLNMVRIVGGIDQLAEQRAAIGF